jgi:hypothetical protein
MLEPREPKRIDAWAVVVIAGCSLVTLILIVASLAVVHELAEAVLP